MKKNFAGLNEIQTALFAQFWAAYPDHSAKKDAQSAFADLDPDQALVTKITLSIQERVRYESIASKKGEKPARWPYPATYLRNARWEDEIGSFVEMRAKPNAGEVKKCTCGKPSMFGAGVPLNHCQACYADYLQDAGKSQTISKRDQYASACKHGLGKQKDETLAEYAARLKTIIGSPARLAKSVMGRNQNRVAGTRETSGRPETDGRAIEYLEAHADHAKRVKA